MDNLHPSKHIIFQIKEYSLIVYRIIPGAADAPGSLQYELYWSDPSNMQGSGPFKTLWDAMNHYNWILQNRRNHTSTMLSIAPPVSISSKIITVDFKSKKKILVIPS